MEYMRFTEAQSNVLYFPAWRKAQYEAFTYFMGPQGNCWPAVDPAYSSWIDGAVFYSEGFLGFSLNSAAQEPLRCWDLHMQSMCSAKMPKAFL